MSWRPNGWNVPPEIKPFGESGKSAWHKIDSFSFEAGADAMLKALREKGQHITDCGSEGTVVFIPDDKPTASVFYMWDGWKYTESAFESLEKAY